MKPRQKLQLLKSIKNIIVELDDMLGDDCNENVNMHENAKKLRDYITLFRDNIKNQ